MVGRIWGGIFAVEVKSGKNPTFGGEESVFPSRKMAENGEWQREVSQGRILRICSF